MLNVPMQQQQFAPGVVAATKSDIVNWQKYDNPSVSDVKTTLGKLNEEDQKYYQLSKEAETVMKILITEDATYYGKGPDQEIMKQLLKEDEEYYSKGPDQDIMKQLLKEDEEY